jgi:spermidine/putrescine-binding protein
MKNSLAVATLVALFTMSAPALVGGADAASDAERAKQQTLLLPDLQKAAAAAARFKNETIEIKSTSHQIAIAVVNSKLNDGVRTDRSAEASNIVSAIAKAIAGKPEFADVVIIHVDYVKRMGNASTVIQGIDFNKAPDGAFQLHLT